MNVVPVCRLLLLSAAFTLASCATSPPLARFSQPLSNIIGAEDNVQTTVLNSAGSLQEMDRQRLGARITDQVNALATPHGAAAGVYDIVVDITRYERGNAAARAFVPGAGEMQIEGYVSVYQMPTRAKVGEFSLSKSFGMPGMYGLVTSMDTIENTFARGVAETVTGRR